MQYSPLIYTENIVVMRGSPFIYRENISEGKLLVGLFILVVAVGGEDKDDDFGVVDFIDKAVLLRDATAPLAS